MYMQSFTLTIFKSSCNMTEKTEIQVYINCPTRLDKGAKQIFDELCDIYGHQTISMRSVYLGGLKDFKAG